MAASPDVLISDDGRYMAVRAADGGLMATSSRSNYTVDSWLRHDGLGAALPWPKPGEASAMAACVATAWAASPM